MHEYRCPCGYAVGSYSLATIVSLSEEHRLTHEAEEDNQ